MTNLSAICPFLPFTFFFVKWTHSKAIVALYVIILFGTKAQWISSTVGGKICFILLAIVFMRILKIKLQIRLIGLNSLGWDGFFYLGDQSNKSLFEMCGILPIIQNSKKKTRDILSNDMYYYKVRLSTSVIRAILHRFSTVVVVNAVKRGSLFYDGRKRPS